MYALKRPSKLEKRKIIKSFEKECGRVQHVTCLCCRSSSLTNKLNRKGQCQSCVNSKYPSASTLLDKGCLPVWYLNGKPMFSLPPELAGLTIAEKLLIQRVSPFVPLSHIKNGTFGLSGHVCAFEQAIDELFNVLPRSKDDVDFIKVVQTMRAEIGALNSAQKKVWIVRKSVIERALIFLKHHSDVYSDIVIDMSRLDFIDGEEGHLEGNEIEVEDMATRVDDNHTNADLGPAIAQTLTPQQQSDYVGAFGYLDEGRTTEMSDENKTINDELQAAVNSSSKRSEIVMDWPAVSKLPVSEFGSKKIFCMAFPWLFPGGIGDIKDFPGDMGKWGSMLLHYEDGRFARDKVFCFYALNYITRHRNNSSGKWFVEKFHSNCPETLADLKSEIANGNTSFVNNLTYYSQRVKGSTPCWHGKRSELYTWINHHVDSGNGAPMYFITLSCAEFQWVDIIRLIKDRMKMAHQDYSQCYVGSPKLASMLNDYCLVVQEYFQFRVETWLKTVGKKIFDIKHYWCRYEFAPGRGQIHVHLLAIAEDQSIYNVCHEDLKQDRSGVQRTIRLASWMKETIGLTAEVSSEFDDVKIEPENAPTAKRFSDIPDNDKAIHDDGENLLKFCMCHECSLFCMRKDGNRYVCASLYVICHSIQMKSNLTQ